MDPSQFINAHVGLAYEREGLHCWELCRRVQEAVYGRTLPVIGCPDTLRDIARQFAVHPERERWVEVQAPVDGALVMLNRTGTRRDWHAGVYMAVDRGGILHTDAPHGAIFERLSALHARGWHPTFYLPKT